MVKMEIEELEDRVIGQLRDLHNYSDQTKADSNDCPLQILLFIQNNS